MVVFKKCKIKHINNNYIKEIKILQILNFSFNGI